VGAALLSAALWIRVQAAPRASALAARPVAPRDGNPRQINLPSGILQSAISRSTKIHRAGPAALHFEQIDARALRAPAQTQAQVGG